MSNWGRFPLDILSNLGHILRKRREENLKNKKILISVIIVLMIIVFLVVFKDKILKIIYPKTYKEIVSVCAEKYNVDEKIIFSVIVVRVFGIVSFSESDW